MPAGLAISPDGRRLAFWGWNDRNADLIVWDLHKNSLVRSWQTPIQYGSEKFAWDLAFAPNGNSLYARTYDEESVRPLKRFEIGSGEITVASPDSDGLAAGKDAVYFIAVSDERSSLRKIPGGQGEVALVAEDFRYNTLSAGGNARWIAAQNYKSGEMIVLDTQTDTVKPVGKHSSVAVLSDGSLVLVDGAKITVADPLQ